MSKEKSFTLLELLIVIAIIAILAATVMVSLSSTRQSAWEARGMQFSQNIKTTLADSLVGEWSFDDENNPGRDDSGNNNNGTIYNGASVCDYSSGQPSGCPVWSDTYPQAKVRGALNFDGVDDWVNIPDSLILRNLIEDLTISFWAYPTNISRGRQNPLGKAYGGEFDLTMEPTGSLSYYHGSASGNSSPYMSCGCNNIFENNKWIFVVVTREINDKKIRFYKNGALQNSSCGSWIAPSSSSRRLGIGYEYAGYFQGLIDEVRIYNRALTAYEIKALYAEGKMRHLADR